MAYSRWGNSVWYTYWQNTRNPHRNKQLFAVCLGDIEHLGAPWDVTVEYAVLKKNPDAFIQQVRETVEKVGVFRTDDEYNELKGYIKRFLQNVQASCRK